MNTSIRAIVIGLVAGLVLMGTLFPSLVGAEEAGEAKFCIEPFRVAKTIKAFATAYSSSPEETDDTPYITASGKDLRKLIDENEVITGVVANNKLKFGTKIRIPSLFGNRVLFIDDRMNARKKDNHFDVHMTSKKNAKEFGAKVVTIEILES